MNTPAFQRLVGLLLLLGLVLPAAAQQTGEGSVYSRFGLGSRILYASSQQQAMGGGGVALSNLNYLNLSNPATWSAQVLTRASGSVLFQRLWATDASGNTSRLGFGALQAVHLSFPLRTRRIGLGLAFRPYTRANYLVRTSALLAHPDLGDTIRYQIDYAGEGGLQQLNAGVGVYVHPQLSVGLRADLIFGIIEHTQRTRFFDPDLPGLIPTEYAPTLFATSTRLAGVRATAGLLFRLPLSDQQTSDALTLGVTFSTPTTLRATRVYTLGESLDRDTLKTALHGDVYLPLSVAWGVSYQQDNRWTFVLDGLYEPWSRFRSDLPFAGYTPNGENLFKDFVRLSAGLEYLPAGTDYSAPYFHQVAYRIGLYWERAYVDPSPEVSLRTLAVTAGLSFPTLFPGTRLDVNLTAGMRGTTAYNLVRDVYYRIGLSLNVGERWFLQRRFN